MSKDWSLIVYIMLFICCKVIYSCIDLHIIICGVLDIVHLTLSDTISFYIDIIKLNPKQNFILTTTKTITH